MTDDRLGDLLATIIPGDAEWPAGDSVLTAVRTDAEAAPDAAAALQRVLSQLPPGFSRGDEVALQGVETQAAAAFERVVGLAYLAYYTDPHVRSVIERLTGYAARPPQPLGYALPPFDEALLDQQRRRAPFWRDPDAVG